MNYLQIQGVRPTGKILGSGSYGEVIEVEWCSIICAAKRMHDIFLRTLSPVELDKMVKDFEKECQIWTSLRHPNIVQLLGIYYPPNSRVPMIVLEKMDTSLRHYLEGHSRENFLLPDKVSILRQVAQGLYYLHSQNPPLVHHDLSPNNILLNEWTFQTKLTDFGMTRAINLSKLTRKSSVKGTFAFMPPEALSDPPRYTEKLDVFSFGNCMITTLTHEWPNPSHPTMYEGDQLIALTEMQRRQHQIDLMSDQEKELFLSLIKQCLEGNPDARSSSNALVSGMREMESIVSAYSKPSLLSQARQAMDQLDLEIEERVKLEEDKKFLQEQLNDQQVQCDHLSSELVSLRKLKDSQGEVHSDLYDQVVQQELQELQITQKDTISSLRSKNGELNEDINQPQNANRSLQQRFDMLQSGCTSSLPTSAVKPTTSVSKQSRLPSRPATSSIYQVRDWKTVGKCRAVIKWDSNSTNSRYHTVAVDTLGTVAATYRNRGFIYLHIDGSESKPIKLPGVSGSLFRVFPDYLGMTFTSSGYIALASANKEISQYNVSIYSTAKGLLKTIALEHSPWGLTANGKGLIYICERDGHCISVYTEEGNFKFKFGSKGFSPGQLNQPVDAACSPDGKVYVCDYCNQRIQIFDEKGTFLKEFQTSGKPKNICIAHDGHVIVAEDRGQLFVFSGKTNELVHKWTFPTACVSFGIAVNCRCEVFVCDSSDIKVF